MESPQPSVFIIYGHSIVPCNKQSQNVRGIKQKHSGGSQAPGLAKLFCCSGPSLDDPLHVQSVGVLSPAPWGFLSSSTPASLLRMATTGFQEVNGSLREPPEAWAQGGHTIMSIVHNQASQSLESSAS